MKIPEHIAVALRQAHAQLLKQPTPAEAVARRLGGIPLYADMGATLIMLLDGSIVGVEQDHDKADPTPLSADWITLGLVAGSRRYPWLSELIPKRPKHAVDCTPCHGKGQVTVGNAAHEPRPVWCGVCYGLGWLAPEEGRGGPTRG